MTITEIIKNWKKVRGKISCFPWYHAVDPGCKVYGHVEDIDGANVPNHDADLPFIASAPQTIDTLVQAMEEAIKAMKAIAEEDEWEGGPHHANDWLCKWTTGKWTTTNREEESPK